MKRHAVIETLGQNPNIHLVLLLLGWDFDSFDDNLVDIRVCEGGKDLVFFAREGELKDHVTESPFYDKTEKSSLAGYVNHHILAPQEAHRLFDDIYREDKKAGNMGVMPHEDRIAGAVASVLQNVPSDARREKEEELQAGWEAAQKEATEKEWIKKTGMGTEGLPEAATEALKDHLREKQIEDIQSGKIII